MSTLTSPAERIAAAGRSRAASVSIGGVVPGAAVAGAASFAAAAYCGWGANPTQGMPVKATTRHDLTPAPRPEEASP